MEITDEEYNRLKGLEESNAEKDKTIAGLKDDLLKAYKDNSKSTQEPTRVTFDEYCKNHYDKRSKK